MKDDTELPRETIELEVTEEQEKLYQECQDIINSQYKVKPQKNFYENIKQNLDLFAEMEE